MRLDTENLCQKVLSAYIAKLKLWPLTHEYIKYF